jgi:hypothetical protein
MGSSAADPGILGYVGATDAAKAILSLRIESYFSVIQTRHARHLSAWSEKHLHRYLAEFDFRHNNRIALGVDDEGRANELAKGTAGKRLTHRRPDRKSVQA